MSANPSVVPLPPPRLIVRVGCLAQTTGAGTQRTGTAGTTGTDPLQLVWQEIETVLRAIHSEAPPKLTQHAAWGTTHVLGRLFFGVGDRWGEDRWTGADLAAFSADAPEIQLLSNASALGSTSIGAAAATQASANGGSIAYTHLQVAALAPAAVSGGLGIGSPTPKAAGAPVSLSRRQASAAQRAQSEALRHHSDILFAEWDPNSGAAAADIEEDVATALREGIPVVAVIGPTGSAQTWVFVRPSDLRGSGSAATQNWQGLLGSVLREILCFPDPVEKPDAHGAASHGKTAYHPRRAFAAFRHGAALRPIWVSRLWDDVVAHMKDRVARVDAAKGIAEAEKKRPSVGRQPRKPAGAKPPGSAPGSGPVTLAMLDDIRQRVARPGMAEVFGNAHRGAIVAAYSFALLAVVFATVGGVLEFHSRPESWKESWFWFQIALSLGELFVILLMFVLERCARVEDWNSAYTDSRILAEALRMMPVLGPLGVHTPLPRLPHYLRGSSEPEAPERLWTVWYFRALLRMGPLRFVTPGTPIDLERSRQDLMDELVVGQRRYHRDNARRQDQAHHDIEWWSSLLFWVVIVCAVAHLLALVTGLHSTLISVGGFLACVIGPALIASLHGYGSQIDVTRLRLRSESVARILADREQTLKAMNLTADPDSPEAVWGLSTEALGVATVLMDETAGWSLIYRYNDVHAG